MTGYPTDFPMDALSAVVKAVKGGDFSDPAGLSLAAWNVQGFAMGQLIGPGAQAAPGARAGAGKAASPRKMSQKKAIEQLEEFVDRRRSMPQESASAPFPIPWDMVLSIAVDLIRDLIAKRASGG